MKKLKLNNKGFAVSIILYTAVILIVLILFLILSIMATITKNKIDVVDNIKEEVSGNKDKKSSSLGELILTASDNKISGIWHDSNFNIIINEKVTTEASVPLTYYYGTDSASIDTIVEDNKIAITNDTKDITYYVKGCRDVEKTVCTKTASYLVNLQKAKPDFTITGEGTTPVTAREYTITNINSLSGIKHFEYYVSDFNIEPSEDDDLLILDSALSKFTITEKGTYIYIRAVSNSNVKSSWKKYNLYVS